MLVNLKNDFEFEQRKFTKEDIKEIIFRKILEYLPQLLKDYMHGSENTYYVLCFYLDISCNLLRGRWWKERASREKTFSSPKVSNYTISSRCCTLSLAKTESLLINDTGR
uniref:Uncharacterized protein n=1 Tax=Aegilops tauschii subsp. strangulata TaxID=200361 RepID=A0A453NMQ6_AEGTS